MSREQLIDELVQRGFQRWLCVFYLTK
jgi:hypothetical protein